MIFRNGLIYVNGKRIHRLNGPAIISFDGQKVWAKSGEVWVKDRLGIFNLARFVRRFGREFLSDRFKVCFDKGMKEKKDFWNIFDKFNINFK